MSAELQKAIYDALVADATVHSWVADRIYDNVPDAASFPYVSFGPSDSLTEDEVCIPGEIVAMQIDVWTRQQGRMSDCRKIVKVIKTALHEAALTIPDPEALAEIRVVRTRAFRDADGITGHGVVDVEAAIEDGSGD